jgi:hypothetical protein
MKTLRIFWGFSCGTLAVTSIIVSYGLVFNAGFAGDVKTGACGNPTRALDIVAKAVPFLIFASLLAGITFAALSRMIMWQAA